MWLRNNKWILLAGLLTGCGFQPVYGKHTDNADSKALAGVKIETISGRLGQEFRADLENLLNPSGDIPANPAYRLSATLASNTGAIGVAPDGSVSRYNIYLDSSYILYRTSDGKAITSGTVRNVSSFNNITNAYFSTFVSEGDATKRGIEELSEIYRQRLSAYLVEGAPVQVTAQPPKLDKNAKPGVTPTPVVPLPPPPVPAAPLLVPAY